MTKKGSQKDGGLSVSVFSYEDVTMVHPDKAALVEVEDRDYHQDVLFLRELVYQVHEKLEEMKIVAIANDEETQEVLGLIRWVAEDGGDPDGDDDDDDDDDDEDREEDPALDDE